MPGDGKTDTVIKHINQYPFSALKRRTRELPGRHAVITLQIINNRKRQRQGKNSRGEKIAIPYNAGENAMNVFKNHAAENGNTAFD
jgi:hypothetical protein